MLPREHPRVHGLGAPMFGVLLLLLAGIWLARAAFVISETRLLAGLAGTLAIGLWSLYRQYRPGSLLCLALFFFLAGIALENRECRKYYTNNNDCSFLAEALATGDSIRLEGTTIDLPLPVYEATAYEARTRIQSVWKKGKIIPCSFTVLLRLYVLPGDQIEWNRGDRIRFLGQLSLPRGYRNVGQAPARYYYWNRNIHCLASCKSPRLFDPITHVAANGLDRCYRLAWRIIDGLPSEAAAKEVLKALLLGQSLDSDELRSAYVDAGIYHILVISGMHLTLVAMTAGWLLSLLRLPRVLHHTALIGMLGVYTVFVQANVSVVRAFLMISLFLAGRMIHNRSNMLNTASLAAVLLIAWKPWYVMDAGFQLTFLAVFALALIAQPLDTALVGPLRMAAKSLFSTGVDHDDRPAHQRARRIRFRLEEIHFFVRRQFSRERFTIWIQRSVAASAALGGMILTSLAVLVFMVPLLATLHFPVALSSVVLTPPAMALVWPLLILLLAFPPVWWLWPSAALRMLAVAGFLANGLNELVSRFALPPCWFFPISPAGMIVYVTVPIWFLSRRKQRPFAVLLIFSGLFAFLAGRQPASPENLTFIMLDVGEGDCGLLQTPEGDNILVDTGGLAFLGRKETDAGGRDLCRRVIIPALLEHGVKRLSALVLTHFDFDHAGSAPGLISAFPIRQVICSEADQRQQQPLASQVARSAAAEGVPVRLLKAGNRVRFHSLQLTVLHPTAGYGSESANQNSLVIEGEWHGQRLLLAGDIDQGVERTLVQENRLHHVNLLKAPHHGSATSSSASFLRAITPDLVAISAGLPRRFNHPSPQVTRRLDGQGIPWVSTFGFGEIDVALTPNGLWPSFPVRAREENLALRKK